MRTYGDRDLDLRTLLDAGGAVDVLTHGADEICQGCDEPAHEVGVLSLFRVTFTDGKSATVRYCQDCERIVRLGVEHPGESYGAAALPDQFAAIEPIAPRVVSAMPCGMSESELVAAYETHAAPMVSEAELTPLARPRGAR